MEDIIRIENVTKCYVKRKTKIVALKNLTMNVPRGKIISILGPNGAGKSTIIKILCGLVNPTSGSISINGYDMPKQRSEVLKYLGVLLEGSRNVYYRLTAYENLEYFGYLKFMDKKHLKKRINFLLDFFNLYERRNALINELSRGMQQKLALAIAMINDPKILLLDEPTLALDVHSTNQLKTKIREIADSEKVTIILCTHQMHVAGDISDKIAIIDKGNLISFKNTESLIGFFNLPTYNFSIKGRVPSHSFNALQLNNADIKFSNNRTILSALCEESSSVFKIVEYLKKNRYEILSINRITPTLEEVFCKVIENDRQLRLGQAKQNDGKNN